jgi:hypothetical protein
MKAILQLAKPTPLAILFVLLGLMFLAVFCSSYSITFTLENAEPQKSERSFGWGAIRIITIGQQTNYEMSWTVLAFEFACVYVVSVLMAKALGKFTKLRRPAMTYGVVAIIMTATTFLASIVVSKVYWGYFFARPPLLPEAGEISRVDAVVPFLTESDDSGNRTIVADPSASLLDRLATGKTHGDESFEDRILLELERRNLLPPAFSATLDGLPDLSTLIQTSGKLAKSSEGYDSSARLWGIAIGAVDKAGQKLVLLGLRGGQVSNDHYPYYEIMFREPSGGGQMSLVRSQLFFYDVAGMEGFEGYVIWFFLSIPGILLGIVIFTICRVVIRYRSPVACVPQL